MTSDAPKVHLSSDDHFGHVRNLGFSNRPFATIGEHDERLIAWHNEIVRPQDIVINFGDLCMGDFAISLAKTQRLLGRRFLIPGNHDRASSAFDRGKAIERFIPIYEAAGWTVLPEHVELELQGIRFAASHYPFYGDSREFDRHIEIRPRDYGIPLLHGHIHQRRHIEGRMFNVGVDVNNYRPVSEDTVVAWAKSLPPLDKRALRGLAPRPSDMPFFDVTTGELR